jgi:DnaJ-domain-containing protein 1
MATLNEIITKLGGDDLDSAVKQASFYAGAHRSDLVKGIKDTMDTLKKFPPLSDLVKKDLLGGVDDTGLEQAVCIDALIYDDPKFKSKFNNSKLDSLHNTLTLDSLLEHTNLTDDQKQKFSSIVNGETKSYNMVGGQDEEAPKGSPVAAAIVELGKKLTPLPPDSPKPDKRPAPSASSSDWGFLKAPITTGDVSKSNSSWSVSGLETSGQYKVFPVIIGTKSKSKYFMLKKGQGDNKQSKLNSIYKNLIKKMNTLTDDAALEEVIKDMCGMPDIAVEIFDRDKWNLREPSFYRVVLGYEDTAAASAAFEAAKWGDFVQASKSTTSTNDMFDKLVAVSKNEGVVAHRDFIFNDIRFVSQLFTKLGACDPGNSKVPLSFDNYLDLHNITNPCEGTTCDIRKLWNEMWSIMSKYNLDCSKNYGDEHAHKDLLSNMRSQANSSRFGYLPIAVQDSVHGRDFNGLQSWYNGIDKSMGNLNNLSSYENKIKEMFMYDHLNRSIFQPFSQYGSQIGGRANTAMYDSLVHKANRAFKRFEAKGWKLNEEQELVDYVGKVDEQVKQLFGAFDAMDRALPNSGTDKDISFDHVARQSKEYQEQRKKNRSAYQQMVGGGSTVSMASIEGQSTKFQEKLKKRVEKTYRALQRAYEMTEQLEQRSLSTVSRI